MIPQHGEIGVDTKEHARSEVRFDHALDVMECLVGLLEISMDDGARVMRERRHRGGIRHQLETFSPVGPRTSGVKGVGQRLTIHVDAPARLLRDDRGRLVILSKRVVRRRDDVAGLLEARHDLARLECLADGILGTSGKVMHPRDTDVDEERQRIQLSCEQRFP